MIVYHGNKIQPQNDNSSTTSLFEVLKENEESLPLQRNYVIDLSTILDLLKRNFTTPEISLMTGLS